MSYKTAFPDFDHEPLMLGVEPFTDASYKNDVCPRFDTKLSDGYTLTIWCDYKEPEARQDSDGDRYMVSVSNADYEYTATLLSVDSAYTLRLFLDDAINKTGATLEAEANKRG